MTHALASSNDLSGHPSPAELTAFGLGRLSGAEAATIEEHVTHCDGCCQKLLVAPDDRLLAELRVAVVGAPASAPPELIDHPRYEILETLGSGGMGTVYKARHRLMNRVVALKVIHAHLLAKPEAIDRFRREVRASARHAHPNIVTAHDAERARDCHFLVMEFVEGESLANLVATRGPLPVAQACDYLRQAALGLQHAAAHGMVHRDIKPQNLMVTARGAQPAVAERPSAESRSPNAVVKILDFGLASLVGEAGVSTMDEGPATEPAVGNITRLGNVMGTPDYMAPEQAKDAHAADIRSDLYSLGCTLYFLLSGQPPFAGTIAEKLAAHAKHPPASLSKVRPDVPPELTRIVERLMAKDPAQRFRTPADLITALDTLTCADRYPRRSYGRWLAAAAAAVMMISAGTMIYLNTGDGTLVLDVNAPDVKVSIDGKQVTLKSPRDEISVKVGRRELEITKDGFTTYTKSFQVRRRGTVELIVRLEPLELPKELTELAKRIAAGLPHDPADPAVTALRQELVDFKAHHFGKPEAVHASRLMTRLAWPADLLKRQQIPADELAAAGDGDPERADSTLVAILGDSRFKCWAGVHGLALSPDGKTLAVVGWEHTVRLLDMESGRPRHTLHGHTNEVYCVAYSVNGQMLASGSGDGTVKLWDRVTGRERATLTQGDWVYGVAFSPDGQTLASAARDKTVKLWDTVTGKERHTLSGHAGEVRAVAFSRDGRTLASASTDGTVKLWDVPTGKERQILARHQSAIGWLAVSRDDLLASGSWDGTVKLYDLATGTERHSFQLAGFPIIRLAFSPDGQTLAVGSNQGLIRLCDSATGKELRDCVGHIWYVGGLAFSPDGRTLISGGGDQSIKRWDVATGQQTLKPHGHDAHLYAVTFSPDGSTLASSSQDGTLQLWDVAKGQPRHFWRGHADGIGGVAFSPDGSTLASGSIDGVKLWDAVTGQERKTLRSNTHMVFSVAFSPDGRLLASGSWDNNVRLWDVSSGDELAVLKGHTSRLNSVAFSPDGNTLCSAASDNLVMFWDVPGKVLRHTCRSPGRGVFSVAFSPDGQTVAAANDPDRSVVLWDVVSGQPRRTDVVMQHSGASQAVAFSPDGDTLASAGDDGMVRLWDPRTGRSKGTFGLEDARRYIRGIAFSPDGRHLATANGNGTVYILRRAPAGKEAAATMP